MTQQMLFDQTPPRQRKRGYVPASSVLAYQERPRDARAAEMTELVSDHPGRTSAELAWAWDVPASGYDVLYVRRGLSDALALGLVEHAGQRKCQVSGRTCVTWKVRTR